MKEFILVCLAVVAGVLLAPYFSMFSIPQQHGETRAQVETPINYNYVTQEDLRSILADTIAAIPFPQPNYTTPELSEQQPAITQQEEIPQEKPDWAIPDELLAATPEQSAQSVIQSMERVSAANAQAGDIFFIGDNAYVLLPGMEWSLPFGVSSANAAVPTPDLNRVDRIIRVGHGTGQAEVIEKIIEKPVIEYLPAPTQPPPPLQAPTQASQPTRELPMKAPTVQPDVLEVPITVTEPTATAKPTDSPPTPTNRPTATNSPIPTATAAPQPTNTPTPVLTGIPANGNGSNRPVNIPAIKEDDQKIADEIKQGIRQSPGGR